METKCKISKKSKLFKLAEKLFESAYKYFIEYNKTCSPSAVVWVTAEDGTMVIFCHEIYGKKLLQEAGILNRNNDVHMRCFTDKNDL